MKKSEIPSYTTIREMVEFLHKEMQPYEDKLIDISRGIEHALTGKPDRGGFVLCAERNNTLVGVLVMLRTGMQGYVPENLLLFLGVKNAERSQGIGKRLIEKAISLSSGSVKLHVEKNNPARRIYERIGFTAKYLDMRITLPERET
jgi:ribosomal-protein-alanine N-acetyltransferase